MLAAVAQGDLNGTGRWTLTPNATGTRVRYDWNVRTHACGCRATEAWANPSTWSIRLPTLYSAQLVILGNSDFRQQHQAAQGTLTPHG